MIEGRSIVTRLRLATGLVLFAGPAAAQQQRGDAPKADAVPRTAQKGAMSCRIRRTTQSSIRRTARTHRGFRCFARTQLPARDTGASGDRLFARLCGHGGLRHPRRWGAARLPDRPTPRIVKVTVRPQLLLAALYFSIFSLSSCCSSQPLQDLARTFKRSSAFGRFFSSRYNSPRYSLAPTWFGLMARALL